MKIFVLMLLVALAGCAGQGGRYQLVHAGNTAWRLDTQTGSLEACGFEAGKPACWLFPAPASKN